MLTATLTPLAQALVAEIDHELELTRRVLARIPEDRFSWRPHPKSMTLTVLATHIADLLGGIEMTMHKAELDLTQFDNMNPAEAGSVAELLERLATNGASATAALTSAPAEAFDVLWTLRRGEEVLLEQTRAEIVRHLISHMIHHRGQLTVYLRLLDVPLPYIYGPSADEFTWVA